MQITLTQQESEQYFYNALCNAIGTGYMNNYGLEMTYEQAEYDSAKAKVEDKCYESILMQVLRDGNKLTLKDIECNGEYTRSIDLKDVHERVAKTPNEYLLEMVNENDDASTADVILQTVFFEDVIFG